ncbi:hypothetical protein K432DRAFT_457645 [Lepidopterella palustris CBS 459.81]|uniref:Sulphur transport domain-containing protein n=1 Tax=Lepidopterella palustris CBS 459.81 TaxID=1314670 RepID=A0A8E2EJD5_9PEZI|nr:hypothetical protein K432DRAFT_457645 [Lepidopterella palustris CBS 459.81]
MTLTGACPGTLLPQLAIGHPGRWVLLGGLLGGFLFTRFSDLRGRPPKTQPNTQTQTNGFSHPQPLRLQSADDLIIPSRFGLDPDLALLAYVGLCNLLLLLSAIFAPSRPHLLNPFLGGTLIGLAQFATVTLIRLPAGMSLAYEAGRWLWCLIDPILPFSLQKPGPLPRSKALTFASGILVGAWMMSRVMPGLGWTVNIGMSKERGVAMGFWMVFGARMAGGCPSGHGFSGMSMLWVASVVTVVSMFLGGVGTAWLIN